MHIQKVISKKTYKKTSWKPLTNRAGSGSVSQLYDSRIRIRTKMSRIHNTASPQNEVTETFLNNASHLKFILWGKWENLAYCKCLWASLYWNTCHGRAGGSCSASPAHSSSSAQDLAANKCWLGYSDFHNLMGFTSKKMPNNILKNVR